MYLDWSLCVDHMSETLEIQNTPLVASYYFTTVVWNQDKSLVRRWCHANCPKGSFCTALCHWQDTSQQGARIRIFGCPYYIEYWNYLVAAKRIVIKPQWILIWFSNTCTDSDIICPALSTCILYSPSSSPNKMHTNNYIHSFFVAITLYQFVYCSPYAPFVGICFIAFCVCVCVCVCNNLFLRTSLC